MDHENNKKDIVNHV